MKKGRTMNIVQSLVQLKKAVIVIFRSVVLMIIGKLKICFLIVNLGSNNRRWLCSQEVQACSSKCYTAGVSLWAWVSNVYK